MALVIEGITDISGNAFPPEYEPFALCGVERVSIPEITSNF
jgi:hypothetical protein